MFGYHTLLLPKANYILDLLCTVFSPWHLSEETNPVVVVFATFSCHTERKSNEKLKNLSIFEKFHRLIKMHVSFIRIVYTLFLL